MRKSTISDTDSQLIHTMRFPLVCLVVIIHSFNFIKDWDPYNFQISELHGSDIYSLFCIAFSMTIAHIAVPTFFVISGFLLFKGFEIFDWNIYVNKIKKRVWTLLIPYISWNTIQILLTCSLLIGGAIVNNTPPNLKILDWWQNHNGLFIYYQAYNFPERFSWLGYECSLSFPILVPMWYIRDLMILCILSPLLFVLFRNTSKVCRNLSLLAISFIYMSAIFPHIPGLSPTPIMYFSIGAFISLGGYELSKCFFKYRFILITKLSQVNDYSSRCV